MATRNGLASIRVRNTPLTIAPPRPERRPGQVPSQDGKAFRMRTAGDKLTELLGGASNAAI